MTNPYVEQRILDFYSDEYDEAARLRDHPEGRLEFARTLEILRRYLPETPADVLDVGGGPGAYARILAADGHRVHLIDPVRRHVDEAAAVGTFRAELGDARALEAEDQSADAVLLLGPLYHLPEREDRLRALREARRVVRPGGFVAAAAISRHAPLLDYMATRRLDEAAGEHVTRILETGVHDPRLGFTTAYFHTVAGFEEELTAAGLPGAEVFGVEGPMWSLLASGLVDEDAAPFTVALHAARLVERDPALLAASAHFLAIARC